MESASACSSRLLQGLWRGGTIRVHRMPSSSKSCVCLVVSPPASRLNVFGVTGIHAIRAVCPRSGWVSSEKIANEEASVPSKSCCKSRLRKHLVHLHAANAAKHLAWSPRLAAPGLLPEVQINVNVFLSLSKRKKTLRADSLQRGSHSN